MGDRVIESSHCRVGVTEWPDGGRTVNYNVWQRVGKSRNRVRENRLWELRKGGDSQNVIAFKEKLVQSAVHRFLWRAHRERVLLPMYRELCRGLWEEVEREVWDEQGGGI